MSIHIVGKLWLPKDEKWFIKVDIDSNSCLSNLRWHGLLGSLSFVAAASTDLAGVTTPATCPMVVRYSTNWAIGCRISCLSRKCNVASFRDQTPGEAQFYQKQPSSRRQWRITFVDRKIRPASSDKWGAPQIWDRPSKVDIISSTNSAFHKPVQNALLNFDSQPKSKNYRQLWLY